MDGPNLYQYALNNPSSFSDPMGLATCPECTKQYNRDVKAKEAKKLVKTFENLLFQTQWFLAENDFATKEEAWIALSGFLVDRGLVSGMRPRIQGQRLATLLIGPADCSDDVNQTLCPSGHA